MLNLIKTLNAPRAISGREKAISDKLLPIIAPHTDKCYNDAMGNLIAVTYGTAPEGEKKKIMLCAHMDEIGFLVTYIEDSGFIRVNPIGGINWVAAAFSEVTFASGLKGILVPEAGASPAELGPDKCWNDPMGNLIAVKYGTAPEADRKKIMLCAHMDEIGFLVTYIEDSGFIRVNPIGGINWVAAAFSEVTFASGLKGILVPEAGASPAELGPDKCCIDIGAKDKREAERKVQIGDYCALSGGVTRLLGRRIAGRPMDDRIGCAVLIKIAEKIKEAPVSDDVYFVFSVQEEVGLRGAKTSAFGINPDIGIAYDVTGTGDAAGSKPMACSVSGGAAIKLKDASVICDYELTQEFAAVAKENGIKHQFEILAAGGTDTAAMQMSGAGVKAAALSIPTRYIHSGVEMLDLNDAEACVELTVAWLKK